MDDLIKSLYGAKAFCVFQKNNQKPTAPLAENICRLHPSAIFDGLVKRPSFVAALHFV